MKKVLLWGLCAVLIVMTAACGSSGKQASTPKDQTEKKVEKTEPEEKYQEFNRFGLFYELPEGTKETAGDKSSYVYTYEDYTAMFVPYEKSVPMTEETAIAFSKNAGNVSDSVESIAVDGKSAFQFFTSGETSDGTVTVIEAPQCFVMIMVGKTNARRSEHKDFNDALINSIKIDDSVEFIEAKEAAPDYYVKERTAVTSECTIAITDYRVLKPGEGANAYGSDHVIVFDYDMTNTAGTRMTPAVEWPIIVTVIQDNNPNAINTLTPAILMDNSATALMQEIKAGGTVHCSQGYTLTDTTTPVTLTFRNGVAGGELGSMTFEVQ